MDYILAYDLGTSGVKGALVTMQGQIAATATVDYPYSLPKPGWAEQEPADYWQGVCDVTREVLRRGNAAPESVVGMAFGTLWKGIIPVDAAGNVLRSSILWLDSRAGEQAAKLNREFQTNVFVGSDYWSKLFWLRENEPETIEKAEMILEVNAFLKWKTTGIAAVDISNSYTRSPDPKLDNFYERLFTYMDIPREKFPTVVNSCDRVGEVTVKAAQELGLVPGIPVFGGNSDIQAVTVGAGCSETGGVHVYLGSSGWVGFTRPHREMSMLTHMDPQREVYMAGMRAVGLSLNWFVKRFYSAEWERLGGDVFRLMDHDAQQIPAGADGAMALPWFFGEHGPCAGADVRGCFLNLKPEHDRKAMARALLEGICFHLRLRMVHACETQKMEIPQCIHAVGGGAGSEVWMQILADVMNIPVGVPESPRHAGALGTAYSALIGLGICKDDRDAAKCVRMERVYEPNPEAVAIYEACFQRYVRLYGALKPIFQMK